jgi:hypothetical protein
VAKKTIKCGSEICSIKNREEIKLLARETDFWMSKKPRMENIKNEVLSKKMQVQRNIRDTIKEKAFVWYGHMRRIGAERLPKKA